MVRRFRERVPTAVAVALATALVAGASGATAGSLITGRQIKNNTVTGADVRNRSLSQRDIAPSTVARMAAVDARTRQEVSATVQQGFTATVAVSCPPGQVATGGGGRLVNEPLAGTLRVSEPTVDAGGTPHGWRVVIVNGTKRIDSSDTAVAYAVCAP